MPQGVSILVDGDPDEELSAAGSVEVSEQVGAATTYRLSYGVSSSSDGDIPMLIDDRLGPGSDLAVVVDSRDGQECLVKGPVTGQSIRLEHGGRLSSLEVQGNDTSVAMDRETKSSAWADLTDSDVAHAVLASYGYVPDVEATNARHDSLKHALVQRDTDLRFVRRLARRNGYLFWVTSDALGIETGHFRRPPLGDGPIAELVINLDQPSIESLEIQWDVERPVEMVASQLELNSKQEMDGSVTASSLEPLGAQSLTQLASGTRSAHVVAPVDDVGDLRARGEGLLMEAGWFVRATTRTTLSTLGTVVRAHAMVNVRGAGSRHSGHYFVTAVRHAIDSSDHRMEIELARNAWGA